MIISQDLFNKLVTSSLLVYCMIMYSISFVQNRPLDLNNFLILIAPLLTHTIHLIDNKVGTKGNTTP